MSHHVVFVSNSVVDISLQITSFPIQASQHQRTDEEVVITAGGQATTLLCGARMGLQMKALGNVGRDEMGSLWMRQLAAEGVDVTHMIVRDDWPTSISVVPSDQEGRHVFLNASKCSNSGPSVLPVHWKKQVAEANVVVLDGWSFRSMGPEVNQEIIQIVAKTGGAIFFDPGPEIGHASRIWTKAMLAAANVVLLTYEEAQQITQDCRAPKLIAEDIRQMGPEIVLLKLGASGIIANTQNESVHQPGLNVPVCDTTGAGDSIIAAVAYSYLHGHSLANMVTVANGTGAACVQKMGAGINAPSRQEVIDVLDHFGFDFVL